MWLPAALLLLILPGCFSIYGPRTVGGPEWGSLTVQCHYDPGYETYNKWWCRGEGWKSCEILVKTTGSEQEVKTNDVSIKDNHENCTFTVTMENLWRFEADIYWCGIERFGTDLGVQVQVIIYPAGVVTTGTGVAMRTTRTASLASWPSTTQDTHSSKPMALTLTGILLCNISFVLLTFLKVLLLGGLLCAVQ